MAINVNINKNNGVSLGSKTDALSTKKIPDQQTFQLGIRLLKSVFGFYFFVTLVLTSIQLFSEYENEQNKVFREVANLGDTVKASLAKSIWNIDNEQIDVTISGLLKIDVVTFIQVEDHTGVILAETGDINFNNSEYQFVTKLDDGTMYQTSIQDDNDITTTYFKYRLAIYINNAYDELELIGYCNIFTDRSSIVGRVKYDFLLIIINAIIKTACLWILFIIFIKRIVTKPLSVISDATLKMHQDAKEGKKADTDFDINLLSTCKDELSDLAKNFINMRSLVLEKIRIINKQNNELEIKVHERTANLKEANEKLRHLSLQDPLTGLPNRNLFHDRLDYLIKCVERESFNFIVASIDLKRFKQINDEYGHQAGDAVLIELAKRMQKVIRPSDIIARMGGDEFGLIAKGLGDNKAEIEEFSKKIVKCANTPIPYEGNNIISGINVGVCVYQSDMESGDVMFKHADIAMYDAKNNGKEFSIYSQKVCDKSTRFSKITNDLNYVIDRQELSVYYQPIIDCGSHEVVGLEALLRWNHSELGFISPDEFIPIAERSSSIKKLTDWVMKQSVVFLQKLNKINSQCIISINLSGRLFNDETLIKTLPAYFNEHDVSPSQIRLELTESAMMHNPDFAIENLKSLKNIGVKLAIDDFGTGYSSFSYLARLPVDEIKIDKSFLIDLNRDDQQVIVEAIINLAHKLNLKVVAEGIESQQILAFVEKYHCDMVQGYFLCHPLPPEEIVEWLSKRI